MADSNLLLRIEKLEAIEAIRRKLQLYCRAIDRSDIGLLKTIFWPDSRLEYGLFDGGGQEFPARISEMLDAGGVLRTHHLIGNIIVTVEGAAAHSETYLQAFHHIRRPDGSIFDWLVGARYQDRFEQRDGNWKIAERKLIYEWYRDWDETCDWAKGLMGLTPENALIGDRTPDTWLETSSIIR